MLRTTMASIADSRSGEPAWWSAAALKPQGGMGGYVAPPVPLRSVIAVALGWCGLLLAPLPWIGSCLWALSAGHLLLVAVLLPISLVSVLLAGLFTWRGLAYRAHLPQTCD
jgi:hypothetical protein